jgi:hypothetical protein
VNLKAAGKAHGGAIPCKIVLELVTTFACGDISSLARGSEIIA